MQLGQKKAVSAEHRNWMGRKFSTKKEERMYDGKCTFFCSRSLEKKGSRLELTVSSEDGGL